MAHKTLEERRAYHARWREKNRARHVDGVRWARIKKSYGLTRETWHALLEAQGGRCAICLTCEPGGRGQFHVDHDHDTGAVRGLLCNLCNRALGMFGDDANRIAAALEYLRRP